MLKILILHLAMENLLLFKKNNNNVIIYLNEGYIDVNNGGNNKYYAIDQIVSIEKFIP